MECQFWIDPPASGAWNMALDESLLEQACLQQRMYWRFYRWAEPTLSLGYFQSYHDRDRHAMSRHCPLVRRLTGGGAILHDREITYSLSLPATHRLARGRDQLYHLVHWALVAALEKFSIHATLWTGSGMVAEEPFLCFQRRASGDVIVGSAKIAGSAQRRRRGAVLQHGSVLLQRSPAAPELLGLDDLGDASIPPNDLMSIWLDKLAAALDVQFVSASALDQYRQVAAERLTRRYAGTQWNQMR